ncbi:MULTISPECIES: hypothetical protein [Brucella/Ochrobactrum group]|jgi:dephospho-CoA kinase|uniref:hypothetical protein n=1 Tax=Brucella/Ochrobactrum group TaxID=2826938 RepID=UPI001C04D322|nr:hypothetical protein [Brucella sp. NBRC 12950]QWK79233.1 hypothetical protein KMS41_17235 [Ochrobactrum sp. BTU1]GLU25430.1 hypothetical protein Brsp01_06630 [Brucella sp. NBRC 12950]
MRSIIMAAMMLAVTGAAKAAEKPIDTYYARLSERDHYSSSGQRLTKVAGIIRQDRANVHQFGKVDAEDEKDKFFSSKENRAKLENMLANVRISPIDQATIINATPVIFVEVYPTYVVVTMK